MSTQASRACYVLGAAAPAGILAVVGSISVDAECLVSVPEEEVGAVSRCAQHPTWARHMTELAAGAGSTNVSQGLKPYHDCQLRKVATMSQHRSEITADVWLVCTES
jgi:hypothetical protein